MAVDVVRGGVKVNALPEVTSVLVNFRIDYAESVASTRAHVEKLVRPLAKKHGLALRAWNDAAVGSTSISTRAGSNPNPNPNPLPSNATSYLALRTFGIPLEPAPRTPQAGGVWELFAGTVRAVSVAPGARERVVAPAATTGNTDCKMYYNLTRNVFRYMGAGAGPGVHTVDERARIADHYGIVDWLHGMIQNADAYDGEE